ncbi:MAG: carboxymuconolactone decarboxylase family protein [Candidatus Omnitrophica bacterium]|nr:carboxymuconolactone decarboxylase family protein [Candidatus Omnitrophota bacterium]
MGYEPKKNLEEFNKSMVDIRKTIPNEYNAFIHEKTEIIKSGKVPEKTKWLLLLVASLAQKCPICVSRAVQHCLQAGWTKEEILEASMVAVLVGGSSVMTYVTLVDKAVEEFK